MLGVRLSDELEEKLERYIALKKISKSQLVKEAIGQFLREQELKEWHDLQTRKGLKEIRTDKGIPGDVVFALLNRWSQDG